MSAPKSKNALCAFLITFFNLGRQLKKLADNQKGSIVSTILNTCPYIRLPQKWIDMKLHG